MWIHDLFNIKKIQDYTENWGYSYILLMLVIDNQDDCTRCLLYLINFSQCGFTSTTCETIIIERMYQVMNCCVYIIMSQKFAYLYLWLPYIWTGSLSLDIVNDHQLKVKSCISLNWNYVLQVKFCNKEHIGNYSCQFLLFLYD